MGSPRVASLPYEVVVLGAGRIGALYDSPGDPHVLSHCHAFSTNPRTHLAGIVDADPARAKAAAARWKTLAFEDVPAALREARPDVVVVSVPTEHHLSIIRQGLASPPKMIVLEKPISPSREDSAMVLDLLRTSGVPCVVNYLRRFLPELRELRSEIIHGRYGKLQSAHGVYSKGLKNNGSHLFNLLLFLIGQIRSFRIEEVIVDTEAQDPTIGGVGRLVDEAPFYLQGVSEKNYSVFELTLSFEKARIAIADFGHLILRSSVVDDPVFPGYRALAQIPQQTKTSLDRGMAHLAAHIVEFLDSGAKLESDLESAMTSETALQVIAEAYARKQSEVTL